MRCAPQVAIEAKKLDLGRRGAPEGIPVARYADSMNFRPHSTG
jgi:hypothetical protein